METLHGINHIHVIGAGGIGISALAKLLLHQGKTVTGSDGRANEATAELQAMGAKITIGQQAENVPADAQAVVFSDAVPESNPERVEASRRGLLDMSYFDLLGLLTREMPTVAVSGTNGKSTTTAILGQMLIDAGQDPTVIVGSRLGSFPDGNLRLGGSGRLVAEACEYRANMLKLAPRSIVLTNIEEEHLDYYRDLDHIIAVFQEYLDGLPDGGLCVVNADDPNIARLKLPEGTVRYGFSEGADYRATDLLVESGRQSFRLVSKDGTDYGQFELGQPGRYNVMNALAALTAALRLGCRADSLRQTLGRFPGIWRRFERLGQFGDAEVVSDYGHTPSAVSQVVRAAREFFPGRRILLCFQPHHRNRTRSLFGDFAAALTAPDELILVEIFDVAGREDTADAEVSSRDLLEAVVEKISPSGGGGLGGRLMESAYVPDLTAAEGLLREKIRPNDVVIMMGAGDIYKVALRLVQK